MNDRFWILFAIWCAIGCLGFLVWQIPQCKNKRDVFACIGIGVVFSPFIASMGLGLLCFGALVAFGKVEERIMKAKEAAGDQFWTWKNWKTIVSYCLFVALFVLAMLFFLPFASL